MNQPAARTWVAATVVVALLLALAAWFLVINPVRADAAAVRAEAADTEARNDQLVQRTAELRRQFANLPDKQRELDALTQALPARVDLPGLISAIDGFASTSGVTIMSIAPGAAAPVVDPAATAAPAPAAPATPGAPTEAAPADGTGTAATAPAVPAGPVTITIPVTTTVIGNFFDAQAFLKRLQSEMPRAYLVRDLSVTAEDPQEAASGRPSTSAGDVTMTITADVFARDPGTDATASAPSRGAAPATPAPAPPAGAPATPAPTPAPGSTPTPGPAPGTGAAVPPVDQGTTS